MVDVVFPLADARRAYEHRATRGKVVVRDELSDILMALQLLGSPSFEGRLRAKV